MPADCNDPSFELPLFQKIDLSTDRIQAGLWEMKFDSSTMKISVTPSRMSSAHMNVKAYIPAPTAQVIWFDPLTGILSADITFQNPSSLNIFDMRMIVYSDNYGFRLMNPDDYTDLFDISGGSQVNAFKTYANGEWRRCFSAQTSQTARLQLYFPSGSTSLNFAVDISYPGNCTEPYLISNFTSGNLKPFTSSTCNASVRVYDWQYNVDSVQFWCPSVSGQSMIFFNQIDLYSWEGIIPNTLGAREGAYTGVIIAGSADSESQMLYDLVRIQIDAFEPFVVQNLPTAAGASDVDINGNYAYIAGRNAELIIADISNPLAPFITSTFPTAETVYYIDADHGFAFLREGNNKLRIVSVDDPYNPGEINTLYTFEHEIRNFTSSDNYVYLAGGWAGLIVVDIHDKRNPESVGFKYLGDYADSVTLSGIFAFVGTTNGYAIIDIRSPDSPQLVNYYVDNSWVEHCAVVGNTLYTAGGGLGGFSIFDITDFMNPVLKSRLNVSQCGQPHELYFRDNCIFLAGFTNWGLVMIDVAVPQNPIVKAVVDAGATYGLAVKDGYAYMADIDSGLRIIQLYQH